MSLTTLMNERLSIGSGMSTGFPELFRFCMEAEIDGRPAVDDSAVRSQLARFAVRQSGLKYTGMRAITALSKGQTPVPRTPSASWSPARRCRSWRCSPSTCRVMAAWSRAPTAPWTPGSRPC
ncbi:hypothetical protein LRS04_15565 [Phenylobacterium sp. J367]|nr:acyl-CoA dehydrogenase family protein [Phenylobacterium sp. J367]MCR5879591.1 hypothetical protein [Phenylobacterium sp. J367]